jgi:hypothetical protein
VAGDHTAGQSVPVVAGPAVVPRRRAARDGGVGGAPGHDDVRPAVQRLDDAPAPEVGVGADEPARVADRLAGLEVRQVDAGGDELVESGQQVVAVDIGDGG